MRNDNVAGNNYTQPVPVNWLAAALLTLALAIMPAGAANAGWPALFGGAASDDVVDMAVDSSGNTIVIGNFSGKISFPQPGGGAPIELNGDSGSDLFVAKVDSSGLAIWARKAAGVADVYAHKVAVDSGENLFISGRITGTGGVTFGGTTLASGFFVSRMDAGGNWQWANSVTQPADSAPLTHSMLNVSVGVAADGNSLFVNKNIETLNSGAFDSLVTQVETFTKEGVSLGTYDIPVTFDPLTASANSLGVAVATTETGNDIYVLLKTDGVSNICSIAVTPAKLQYLVKLHESASSSSCEWAIAVSGGADGTEGEIVTDGSDLYYASRGQVTRINGANGTAMWSSGVDDSSLIAPRTSVHTSKEIGLAVDQGGNVYLSGIYTGAPSFIGQSGEPPVPLPVATEPSVFVAKISPLQKWQWATAAERPEMHPQMNTTSMNARIALGPEDAAVHIAGALMGVATFDGSSIISSHAPTDGGLLFDGEDDYIKLPGNLLNAGRANSVSFKVKIDPSATGSWSVFSGSNQSQDNALLLFFANPQTLSVWERDKLQINFSLPNAGLAAINDGQWHNILFTRLQDADTITYGLYVDGNPRVASTIPCLLDCDLNIGEGDLLIGQEQDCEAGCFDPNQALEGRIGEFSFWNIAFSEPVNTFHAQSLQGDEPYLMAYWDFNDPFTAGTQLLDISPYGHDVELVDIPLNARPVRVPGAFSTVTSFTQPLDGYLAAIDSNGGNWLTPQNRVLGEALTPPNDLGLRPDIKIAGMSEIEASSYFYWNEFEKKLYAVRTPPSIVTIEWRISTGQTLERSRELVVIESPAAELIQYHVAGTSLPLEPLHDPADPSQPLRYYGMAYSVEGSGVANGLFTRGEVIPGDSPYVVLHYTRTATADQTADPATQGSLFQVVYTLSWNDPSWLELSDACTIGEPITDPEHVARDGKNGHLVFERAFYDGVGADAAHNRETRMGPIIPVNKDTVAADDDMAVVWYTANSLGQAWPDKPVKYHCEWPVNPQRIVIADQGGSGPLPVELVNRRIYNQPDATLPGYNPNEEHALLTAGESGAEAFALRNDLNGILNASEPYVLLKYQDSANDNEWGFKVYHVEAMTTDVPFAPVAGSERYTLEAGLLIQPPRPLSNMPLCGEDNAIVADPNGAAWPDHTGSIWAKAQGNITLRYYYPLQAGFFYDFDGTAGPDEVAGTCVPWLDRLPGGVVGTPVDIDYALNWPAAVPVLSPGETVYSAKEVECSAPSDTPCNLPQINGQAAARIIFDETWTGTNKTDSLVKLIDPMSERAVVLDKLADTIATNSSGAKIIFTELPFYLRARLSYDELNKSLAFAGWFDDSQIGDPHLLPNIMSLRERERIKAVPGADAAFKNAVDQLYNQTRNPNAVDSDGDKVADLAYRVGLQMNAEDKVEAQALLGTPMALSAGRPAASGYVTLAFNDDPSLSALPVSLQVLKVANPPDSCNVYQGSVWIVPSDNIFEEALTLRHSGDFAGDPDLIDFQWYYQPDMSGQPAAPTAEPPTSPWLLHPASGSGAVDVTIEGPGLLTLSDNWFVVRYGGKGVGSGLNVCDNDNTPSRWAGDPSQPASAPKGMLATGWIKRVVGGLNPFDSRVTDFHDSEVNTLSSMIAQAGEPYAGPIPFNSDSDVLNGVGLIEAYQTVLERGKDLSINAGFNDVAANTQLLNVATRIADMYMMLGNEAYADAQDPTIGFDTGSDLGTLASSIFTFQNQLASPLEEELALLRGRDDSRAGVAGYPVYNRLFWNFTQGEGEVAYAQSYAITDQNVDGFINESDARILYPQGHGDAWGHYLTSVKSRYALLQEPNFTWVPRAESVLVAGVPIEVDYLDERKFAAAAAAKARAGAEIVNLTYRQEYVEAPAGQWQGYKDTDTQRAWGLDGWGRRAGQGAYFDWLTSNAILPAVDHNPTHQGIEKVDRTTVAELSQIVSGYLDIQAQVDQADAGLNPLGLAKGVVPFDIDPSFLEVGSGTQGQSHFDQIASRAQAALNNAVQVFDHASQQSQSLRSVQDDVDALTGLLSEQERDYKNQLIEIFGYPYAGNIGAGKRYPSGYDGPDISYYMYVNSDLTGELPPPDGSFTGFFTGMRFGAEPASHIFPGDVAGAYQAAGETILEMEYPTASGADWTFVAPADWGQRRAPGELQVAVSDLLQAQAGFKRALTEHANLLEEVQDAAELLTAEFNLQTENVAVLQKGLIDVKDLNGRMLAAESTSMVLRRGATVARETASVIVEAFPKAVGTSCDVTSFGRSVAMGLGVIAANVVDAGADAADIAALTLEKDKEAAQLQTEIELITETTNVDLEERLRELEQLWRQEAVARLELYTQAEVVQQSLGSYQTTLARGQRLLEERVAFRIAAAADTQQYRYRDMTFRIFRNDALQKYRAQFELAARYIYLAATAYDYETNLLGGDHGSGSKFLADIVRQRSLGQVIDGVPVAGTPGLADVLARMTQNFEVYRGQLGFNNPQIETNRFSLRRELFRLGDDSDAAWQKRLSSARVDDLWQVPEFRRYMRPFAPESAGPQPGIVIRFPSTVTFGLNFFGHELGGGDSAYDPSNFATKVRAVGTWFSGYNSTSLSNTPRLYLVPVGMDVLRSPSGNNFETREWKVIDQKLPVPFPIGASDLSNPEWIPINDSLSDTYADIRRSSSYRAYHDSGAYDPAESVTDTRLVGRSVWNTEWMLVIPGGTLLNDPQEGLEQFINGQLTPDGEARDGNGISDIQLHFQTYGYSGN